MKTEATSLLATFSLGGALFALDAAAVQEVVRLATVTPVRHGPAEVAGVINLRGRIVTLLDTGLLLGLPAATRDGESRVFIVEDRGEYLGLLVDRVGEVIEIEPGSGEALPLNIPPALGRFFGGICRSGGRVIARLNTTELLTKELPT
ncbi:MAG: chemotaxis protein CheW [Bryobacteraceae bacterium]|nr:chemotaxis protein CheW [Bryobacteraceae bacterium]